MEKLNAQTAKKIAEAALRGLNDKHHLKIVEEKTQERVFGYVFSYVPERYLKTKDPDDLIPGNGPLVVDRSDLKAHFLSTATDPETALKKYEAEWLSKNRKK